MGTDSTFITKVRERDPEFMEESEIENLFEIKKV